MQTRVSHVTIQVGDDDRSTAHAHDDGAGPDGSVMFDGIAIQVAGTPAQIRSFSKALEDGAMEIERQIAEQAHVDTDPVEHFGLVGCAVGGGGEVNTASTRDEAHTCHALACEAHVPPRMHMCERHWFMIPKSLRDGLWGAYRPGQERRMDPSPAYLLAAARCVHAVASKEGHDRSAIAEEVDLYETWANMLTDEPQDFMALIEAGAVSP